MKAYFDSEKLKTAIYAFLVLAAAILFYLLLQHSGPLLGRAAKIAGYLSPGIYGFVFAFLLNPLMRVFDDKLLPKLGFMRKAKRTTRRGVAILITYLITGISITLFLALLLPQIVGSLIGIGANVPSYMKSLQTVTTRAIDYFSGIELLDDSRISTLAGSLFTGLVGGIESLLGDLGDWLTSDFVTKVWEMASGITSGALDIVLGVIISIYFLADREKLFAQLGKACAAIFSDRANRLFREVLLDANRMFSGFIIGKVIDSVIIGILCFAGMLLLRLPHAMLISVIVGVTNVIPYFGPFIGAIPGILLVFISHPDTGPVQAVIFGIFILVLQQFDGNILGPKILGDSLGLSAFWIIFSIMLFSGMFGIMGMFIGVPLFAVLYNIAGRLVSYILRRKGKSTDTGSYASESNPLIK